MFGAGLLLLRAAIGVTAILQGAAYLSHHDIAPLWMWSLGLLAVLAGVALIVGLLTTWTSLLIALAGTGTVFSLIPVPALSLSDRKLPTALVIVMAVAITLTGPGAWSVDARLFGLRKITIPRSPRPSDS